VKTLFRRSTAHRALAGVGVLGILLSFVGSQSASLAADSSTSGATSSQVTLAAADYDMDYVHAPMPDLKVTVSQTQDLTSQGVIVSWTGANGNSVRPSGSGGANFLQIFQCWGDDPLHPGHPDRTTCQYGALPGPGSARSDRTNLSAVDSQDVQYTKPGQGFASPPYTSIPLGQPQEMSFGI